MKSIFQQVVLDQLHVNKNDRVIIALSGGVDSVVLLDLLLQVDKAQRPQIFLSHVHHHLRAEADQDLALVEKLAKNTDLPLTVHHWWSEDHPATGIEATGRRFRYACFKQDMVDHQASVLMTGHHQSDQLETLLMRLVRGGSWERMAGIQAFQPFESGRLLRPLLAFTKEEIYQYAEQEGLPFVEDETNASLDYTRNRYRQKIIPLLKEENPQAERQAQVLAKEIQMVKDIIAPQAEELLYQVMDGGHLLVDKFLHQAPAWHSLILRTFLKKQLDGDHVEVGGQLLKDLLTWIQKGQANSQHDLPGGVILQRTYNKIYVRKPGKPDGVGHLTGPLPLEEGEWINLADGGRIGMFSMDNLPLTNGKLIYIDKNQVQVPLWLDHRRPGDRMTLKGPVPQSKKIKDIFIDQKIPLEKRDQAWLVRDDEDVIIWLVGYKESSWSLNQGEGQDPAVIVYEEGENNELKK